MNPETLVSEALVLMMLGMGTVFLFLTLLVLVTGCMSALVMRYPGAGEPGGDPPATPAGQVTSDSRRRLAAVTAAVHFHHRSRHEGEQT